MDEFSFDPRDWAKKPAEARPAPSAAGGADTGADAAKEAGGGDSLPEAWRAVSTAFRPGAAPAGGIDGGAAPEVEAEAAQPAPPRDRLLLTLLSAGLLLAGGAWAWTTRAPPDAPATAPQPVRTPPPAGAVERAFNLSSAAELERSLIAVGVPQAEAAAAARAAATGLTGKGVIRASVVMLPAGEGFALQELQASYADGSGTLVKREPGGRFAATHLAAALQSVVRVLRGEIDSESFYTSAVAAGVTDTLIPEFINAFAYDFNLASEVTPGDTFEVAFEEAVNADGEPVGQPKLLFASLTTKTKSLALYRYVDPDGKVAWYDGNGAVTQRGFMRTPIDGARITSKFGMRFHPVLHYTRLHGGTDFAAPVGTPIYAAAAATVTSASPSRCAGNMVILRHENGYETRYFHLSRYADGLAAGQQVEQGHPIGFVGNPGTCTTGPHLHYEVHINGEKVDPLSIKTDDSKRKRMTGDMLSAFRKERDRVDQERARQVF